MLPDTALTLRTFAAAALGARVYVVLGSRRFFTSDRSVIVASILRGATCWLAASAF